MNRNPGTPRGFVLGALVGGAIAALVVAVAGYAFVKHAEREATRGWNLVDVVVAAQDIPEGSTLAPELLAVRKVPEQFVTTSLVRKNDAVSVMGKPTLVPMQAGDPIWRAHVRAR